MKLNFQAGSSPLASRHNPVIYSAIFVGIIIIFIAIIIWFLLKKLDTLHQTEEWIEKQKDRPTKKSDVIKTARKYNFTDEETNLLWKICHKFKANNIFCNFKSSSFLYDLFFNGYQYFSEINDQASLSNLFNLKFKIEKIIAESLPTAPHGRMLSGIKNHSNPPTRKKRAKLRGAWLRCVTLYKSVVIVADYSAGATGSAPQMMLPLGSFTQATAPVSREEITRLPFMS